MEMRSCSVRMKNLIKVRLSEGGGVQLDFPIKRGGLIMNVIVIEKLCWHACHELSPRFSLQCIHYKAKSSCFISSYFYVCVNGSIRTCAYEVVRNVGFSKKLVCLVFL